ncbi:MAG: methyltransferase domain-containing protein [Candidatus Eutrophobiaceae bacterium]
MTSGISSHWHQFSLWCTTPHGHRFLDLGAQLAAKTLPELRGEWIAQLGAPAMRNLMEDCPMRRSALMINLEQLPKLADRSLTLACMPHGLPIKSESLDVLVIWHALEFMPGKLRAQCLAESARVLCNDGHLLLIHYNALSLQGLGVGLRDLNCCPLLRTRPLLKSRLCAALAVHNLTILECLASTAPLASGGAVSLIHAHKNTFYMTPSLRNRWKIKQGNALAREFT